MGNNRGNNRLKKVTAIFIVLTIVIIAVYDVWVYIQAGGDATISRIVYNFSKDWPIVNIIIGVLLGHFYWPQKVKE